jgi:hypothetical protein
MILETIALNWALLLERVTRIELARSARKSVQSGLSCGLTCEAWCPRVTVRDRSLPGLLAPRSRPVPAVGSHRRLGPRSNAGLFVRVWEYEVPGDRAVAFATAYAADGAC